MARAFVSFASRNSPLAEEVHRWLVDDGHDAFLDRDLDSGILVGDAWHKRLHERLRWADAVICLLTSAYTASPWCTAELGIAQSRGNLVLPVRAEPEASHPLLADAGIQYVDMTEDAGVARAKLAAALLRLDAAGGRGWADDRSPFPGLRPLNTDEHSVFFGRAHEVDQLATLLRSPAERADPAALIVVGPSGCGKSSLVRAGLLPVMAAEPEWWTLPAILPGAHPVAALARELAASHRQVGLPCTVTDVRHRLDANGFTGLVDDLLHAVRGSRRRHLLLVVDQFEELLTQTGPEERARFAALLRDALTGPVQVVATLRPEFLGPLLASPDLSALPARTHALRPLQPEALRAVIEGPADRAGIGVDAELVTRLVADTGGGEALPLLAYTLAQLTDGVAHGGRLSAARYEQLGGVHGALAGQAHAALAEAVTVGGRDRDQVIRELLRLVTVDEQGRPTRWRIHRDELAEQVRTEMQPFIDRRLLITDTDNGDVVIGVAHEAFLSAWPPLSQAITAAATALRARREIEQAAKQWVTHGHPPSRLWERGQLAAALADTGARLQTMRTARKTDPPDKAPGPVGRSVGQRPPRRRALIADRVELSARARDFLRASIRRDRRRRGRAITILSALLVLALGLATFAFGQQRAAEDQRNAAREERNVADARRLAAQAIGLVDRQDDLAQLLALESLRRSPTAEGGESLQATLSQPLHQSRQLVGHSGAVLATAFTSDGGILATASSDATVKLWDITTGATVGQPLMGHDAEVLTVAFHPDDSERVVASGSADGTIRIWSGETGGTARTLSPEAGPINAVAYSPDGRVLAAGGSDGRTFLWDSVTGQPIGPPLVGHVGEVFAVAFRPDGQALTTAGRDATIRIWDLETGQLLVQPLVGHMPQLIIWSLAFSPDGTRLASTSADGQVLLWDAPWQESPTEVPFHDDLAQSVTFHPSGDYFATAGLDGVVRLWDNSTLEPALPPMTGHVGRVNAVVFSPDGDLIATAGNDSTARLWRTAPQQPIGEPLWIEGGTLGRSTFSPDGNLIATSGDDGIPRLWEADTQLLLHEMRGHTDNVEAIDFSPDGRILASGSQDATVRLWRVDSGEPAGGPLTGHAGAIPDLAFSPRNDMLATAGADGTMRLWHLDTGRPVREPVMHEGLLLTVDFSPDGAVVATAGAEGVVHVWDVATGQQAGDPFVYGGGIINISFSADGQLLGAAGFDGDAMVWDVASHEVAHVIPPFGGPVVDVSFSPDREFMAIALFDGTVRLWNLFSDKFFGQPIEVDSDQLNSVAFSPDGSQFVASGINGQTKLHAAPRRWITAPCSIVGRNLSQEEWDRYAAGEKYVRHCAEYPAGIGASPDAHAATYPEPDENLR